MTTVGLSISMKETLRKESTLIYSGTPTFSTPTDLSSGLRGLFEITVTDLTTLYSWSIRIKGGLSLVGVIGYYNYIPGSEINCTPSAGPNTVTITTPIGDSGGRSYNLIFNQAPLVPPTIQQTGGAAIVGNSSVRLIEYICF